MHRRVLSLQYVSAHHPDSTMKFIDAPLGSTVALALSIFLHPQP